MFRRTFREESDVYGGGVRSERHENASGTSRNEQGLGHLVRHFRHPGLDHARGDVQVIVRELEVVVVAQLRHFRSRSPDVARALAGDEEPLEPGGKGRGGGVLRGEISGHADTVRGHVRGTRLGGCRGVLSSRRGKVGVVVSPRVGVVVSPVFVKSERNSRSRECTIDSSTLDSEVSERVKLETAIRDGVTGASLGSRQLASRPFCECGKLTSHTSEISSGACGSLITTHVTRHVLTRSSRLRSRTPRRPARSSRRSRLFFGASTSRKPPLRNSPPLAPHRRHLAAVGNRHHRLRPR